jgi:hypothetical protein
VIDVTAGFVPVCVFAGPLADWVLLVGSPVALETAPVAAFAALDATLLTDPDPQPLSSAVAIPSASAATTIGTWTVNLTIVRPLAAVGPPVATRRSVSWPTHAASLDQPSSPACHGCRGNAGGDGRFEQLYVDAARGADGDDLCPWRAVPPFLL